MDTDTQGESPVVLNAEIAVTWLQAKIWGRDNKKTRQDSSV